MSPVVVVGATEGWRRFRSNIKLTGQQPMPASLASTNRHRAGRGAQACAGIFCYQAGTHNDFALRRFDIQQHADRTGLHLTPPKPALALVLVLLVNEVLGKLGLLLDWQEVADVLCCRPLVKAHDEIRLAENDGYALEIERLL